METDLKKLVRKQSWKRRGEAVEQAFKDSHWGASYGRRKMPKQRKSKRSTWKTLGLSNIKEPEYDYSRIL